jgi:UDP-glucuronate 4-epimerase
VLTNPVEVPEPTRYLITGALGCIGAWTARALLEDGLTVVALDMGQDDRRLRQVIPADSLARVIHVAGDVTDQALLERIIAEHGIDSVIHLAALQVPACRADPVLGARVNVTGFLSVFEAVKRRLTVETPVVYASSVAVYDATDTGQRPASELAGRAGTHYGTFKRANEGAAGIYWTDDGIASIGLRPYVVYGPGRDQGVTSEPTLAMQAAARGSGYHMSFGGYCQMQYAHDVARNFVNAARSAFRGAAVANLGGSAVHARDIVAAIEAVVPESRGQITFDDRQLPFPARVAAHTGELYQPPPETSLLAGVRETVERFRGQPGNERQPVSPAPGIGQPVATAD